MDWNKIPSKGTYVMFAATMGNLITAQSYGQGPNKWNLTEILRLPDIKRIPASNIISGDAANGTPRPDRALKQNGIPFMFRLRVLTRQACWKTVDGKKVCVTDEEYSFHSDGVDSKHKVLAEAHDNPKPGDIVRIKDRLREPDNVLDQQTIMGSDGSPLLTTEMMEPHLSVSHIEEWVAAGEDIYIYQEFVVDKDLCISAPLVYAQSFLNKHGHRIARPQWRKVDKLKLGEKPPRRITNWWFIEDIPKRNETKNADNKGKNQGVGEQPQGDHPKGA